MILEIFDSLASFFNRFFKFFAHLFTGESQIFRILKNKGKNNQAAIAFFDSLYYSKKINHLAQRIYLLPAKEFLKVSPVSQLKIVPINLPNKITEKTLQDEILNASPWEINEVLSDIVNEKFPKKDSKFSEEYKILYNKSVNNLFFYLQELKLFQVSIYKLDKLKKTKFDQNNEEHWQLLDDLWNILMPDTKRSHKKEGEDWKKIGFQGSNPATDLRGYGMLSLHQLLYFAKNNPEGARAILAESNKLNTKENFFPFAASAINVTSFIFDAISLPYFITPSDVKIIPSLDFFYNKNYYNFTCKDLSDLSTYSIVNRPKHDWVKNIYLQSLTSSLIYDNSECIDYVISHINEFYSTFFLLFAVTWKKYHNPSIMDFPKIFTESKREFIDKYGFH